jgi:putative flippase GtrA
MKNLEIAAGAPATSPLGRGDNPLRRHVQKLPRPIRFLGVGSIGLLTDLCIFTVAIGAGLHPLVGRLVSMAVATIVTWRLNRAFTFEPSGRHQSEEAARYAFVTAIAAGTNYIVFATLVVALLRSWPQAAVLAGAAAGAMLSYIGHRIFSFARCRAALGCEAAKHKQKVPLR